ncbi:hypothetical protein PR048_017955 [Dryococelus australis]|uniref:Uncharacterized protein n=1 Tax=Dryococelus australis TaxID=614101 RepID=A0ABQ9HB28_9NEOP|nr:hypothetical protein PR048_017955 [Dryococelus australis]
MLFLHRPCENKHRRRLPWVRPILQMREELGAINILLCELRKDENKFFKCYRMFISSFEELLGCLKLHLQNQNIKMRNCIQPEEMLSAAIRRVCTVIWAVMVQECIGTPTVQQWEEIALKFESRANFTRCLLAVDVNNPQSQAFKSLLDHWQAQTIGLFTLISEATAKTEKSIAIRQALITTSKTFRHAQQRSSAFFLIKSYRYQESVQLSLVQSPTLLVCVHGILTNKWRIFHLPLNIRIGFVVDIVKACE